MMLLLFSSRVVLYLTHVLGRKREANEDYLYSE